MWDSERHYTTEKHGVALGFFLAVRQKFIPRMDSTHQPIFATVLRLEIFPGFRTAGASRVLELTFICSNSEFRADRFRIEDASHFFRFRAQSSRFKHVSSNKTENTGGNSISVHGRYIHKHGKGTHMPQPLLKSSPTSSVFRFWTTSLSFQPDPGNKKLHSDAQNWPRRAVDIRSIELTNTNTKRWRLVLR